MLANRLRKRQRHLRKWSRRRGVTSYRLYERDIPDYPLIVDWYDGCAVVWLYARTKDETADAAEEHEEHCIDAICDGLELTRAEVFVKQRQRQRGLQQYERVDQAGVTRVVEEHGLNFEVNLTDYLDTGLFLDHRTTRTMVREIANGMRVLNLFAYTGSFTCSARAGGASSTHTVDLSNGACAWTVRNLALNGWKTDASHVVERADCLTWLDRAAGDGLQFDIIVCDPPTFSNSKSMAASSFAVDRDHPSLIGQCHALLAPGGTLVFSTNSRRFQLQEDALPSDLSVRNVTSKTIPDDFRNDRIHHCWWMVRSASDGG